MWLLQLPTKLSTPFLHGGNTNNGLGFTRLPKPATCVARTRTNPQLPGGAIKAMKTMEGKVVCSTNDKTVAVEVVRLAPHPKYKKRIRKKKKYQAHDPDNQFQIGDIVQLCKTRPISKTKTFLAVPAPNRKPRNSNTSSSGELQIPLESQQHEEEEAAAQA